MKWRGRPGRRRQPGPKREPVLKSEDLKPVNVLNMKDTQRAASASEVMTTSRLKCLVEFTRNSVMPTKKFGRPCIPHSTFGCRNRILQPNKFAGRNQIWLTIFDCYGHLFS